MTVIQDISLKTHNYYISILYHKYSIDTLTF